jgi:hypothetical protein
MKTNTLPLNMLNSSALAHNQFAGKYDPWNIQDKPALSPNIIKRISY